MESTQYRNPFSRSRLFYPKTQREIYSSLCRESKSVPAKIDQIKEKPFPRMVDLWFLGICMGANRKKKFTDIKIAAKDTHVFTEGSILEDEHMRINIIKLIAIEHKGKEVLSSPADMIEIANLLAIEGVSKISEIIKNKDSDMRIDELAEGIIAIINKK